MPWLSSSCLRRRSRSSRLSDKVGGGLGRVVEVGEGCSSTERPPPTSPHPPPPPPPPPFSLSPPPPPPLRKRCGPRPSPRAPGGPSRVHPGRGNACTPAP